MRNASTPGRRTTLALSALSALLVLAGLAAPGHAEAATAPPPGVTRANTFVDSFDNNRLDGWDSVDQGTHSASRWRASGHHLSETSGTYGGSTARSAVAKPGTMLVGGNPSWTDIDYSVSVRSDDDDDVGVVFRYQDGADYYRFSMDRQRGYQRLVKRVAGAYTLLAENTTRYRTGAKYRLRVQAVGERLRVLVDGHRVFDVVDGSLSQGRVGLYAWGNASTVFDTLVVRSRIRDFFTVAVVPDTQFATRSYTAMLGAQMRWLAANRARENLSMVLQEGDVVDDLTQSSQWVTAHRYYSYLDGKVPFVVAAGNHDQEDLRHTHRPYTKQPAAFTRFLAGFQDYRVDGAYRPGDYRNTYRLFTAGGVSLLALNLDFGASDPVLAWAGRVLDAHPSSHVLMLTHDYLGTDNAWRGTSNPDDGSLPHHHAAGLNDGVQIGRPSGQPGRRRTLGLPGAHELPDLQPRRRGLPAAVPLLSGRGARRGDHLLAVRPHLPARRPEPVRLHRCGPRRLVLSTWS